jgi:hypothetical protein
MDRQKAGHVSRVQVIFEGLVGLDFLQGLITVPLTRIAAKHARARGKVVGDFDITVIGDSFGFGFHTLSVVTAQRAGHGFHANSCVGASLA